MLDTFDAAAVAAGQVIVRELQLHEALHRPLPRDHQAHGNRGLGLAAGAAGSVANCVKTLTRADAVGLQKPGLLAWTVVQSAVALLAFKNELA